MKLKEDKIDIYNNSAIILNKKTPNYIITWIIILSILCLLFITIIFIPYNVYETYSGYVSIKDNESYIVLDINKSNFPINKNNKLYIYEKKYKYKVISIDNNILVLKVNLNNNIKINNNIVSINILKERTTMLKKIKYKIKKGMGL